MLSRRMLVFPLFLVTLSGCASAFLGGGRFVAASEPLQVLVTYRAEGTVPPNTDYLLVRGPEGEAILERSADGSGTLALTHWSTDEGDHYACWVRTAGAYDYLVPKDRSQPAKRFFYPKGTYQGMEENGVTKIVPTTPIEAQATLHPLE